MFAFPSVFKPVMPILVNGLASRLGSRAAYRPEDYYFWAWAIVIWASAWAASALYAFIRKPADDRRIDENLRARLSNEVRGAPTEPI